MFQPLDGGSETKLGRNSRIEAQGHNLQGAIPRLMLGVRMAASHWQQRKEPVDEED